MNEVDEQLVRAYRLCFGSPAGRQVLDDLMVFCRFRVEVEDQIQEGQRRVFLRIMQILNLEMEQLEALFRRRLLPSTQQEESEDG